jgi:putative transposase
MKGEDIFLDIEAISRLVGLKSSAIKDACAAGKYTVRKVPSRGKTGWKYEIALSSLHETARRKYLGELAATRLAEAPAPSAPTEKVALPALRPEAMDETQRLRDQARKLLIEFIETYAGPVEAALDYLNTGYADGTLDSRLRAAMVNANDKANAERIGRLTRRSFYNWKKLRDERGTLAPLKTHLPDLSVKPWHAAAIALKQRPQGMTLTAIVEALAREFRPPPSYDQVCRFFREKFSAGEQLEGRWTGMQLRAKKHYTERTTQHLKPWDELHADGWTTHFSAPHPVTGEFVTYELWDVHDLATRYVPPIAIGMKENFEVIFKAIENAVRCGGVPAILQTDSTKIVKAGERFKNNPATALEARAGMTIVHPSAVGNAQANGMAENFHTYLDREARALATYQHERMDRMTFKRVQKFTKALEKARASGDQTAVEKAKRDVERAGQGILLDGLDDIHAWVEAVRQKWNHHPCRSLKKVRDPETGRLRHQTPHEALEEHKATGWDGVMLDEQHLQDLFRPHVQVKVRRNTVKPYGGMRFYHPELWHWEGKDVVVAYDIDDWRQVWVKDLKTNLICVAAFDEAKEGRAKSFREDAEERRALSQIQRREKQIDRIKERVPGLALEHDGGANDAGRLLNISDLLTVPALAEPEKTIHALLPERGETEETRSYTDTVMWLYGKDDEDKDEEGAAGQ